MTLGNTQNKNQQDASFESNIRETLKTLHNLSDGYFDEYKVSKKVLALLTSRFSSVTTHGEGASIQRDLGYFLLLIFLKYDFGEYKGDSHDLQKIFESKSNLIEQSAHHPTVVRMIQEAQQALDTFGEEPSVPKMLQATQSDIANMVKNILSN